MQRQPRAPERPSLSYTARHRHHLPGVGYTDWSAGLPNQRHSHSLGDPEGSGYVEDSIGSPVHRHAWNRHTHRRIEHAYTSGPLRDRALPPGVGWIARVLHR